MTYTGRFAPSPTGPLHFGSLIAAAGSYLEARSRGGRWLVRIEDIDPPREMPGAGDLILTALDAYGFQWDGPVLYQSRRAGAYRDALERLASAGLTYHCACSRREAGEAATSRGLPAGVYPGTCRSGLPPGREGRAVRVDTHGAVVAFEDRLQGPLRQALETEVGDFVLWRADGLASYQLAVVVDDAEQGVTDVVRGADLLGATARQIHLQRLLGLPSPGYAHLPVAVDANGEKLSKQTYAAPLELKKPGATLWRALAFLGQEPPAGLLRGPIGPLWEWALSHWQLTRVPGRPVLPADAEASVAD